MDDELLDQLRAHQADPAPASLLAAAKAAYSWRTDDPLAAPSYDSLLDESLSSVRGEQESRLLSFSSSGLTLDLEVAGDGQARRLVGQLDPAQPADVVARHGGGQSVEAAADEWGRFVVERVDAGPLSLRVTSGERVLHTEWVLV